MKALIENGANIDHQNKNGVTALKYAAQEGHTSVVKLLIDTANLTDLVIGLRLESQTE